MSDDRMKLGIELDINAQGTELIDALVSKVRAMESAMRRITAEAKKVGSTISGRLGATSGTDARPEIRSARELAAMDRAALAEFKRNMALKSRLTRQHAKEIRLEQELKDRAASDEAAQSKAAALADVRRFRERMRFTSAMGRQAAREERDRVREVERSEQRSIAASVRAEMTRTREQAAAIREGRRQEAADTRRHESQRSRAYSDLRSGGSDIREGTGRVVRGAGAVTAAGVAATGAATRKGISTRLAVEAEETSISIFSGKTRHEIAAARKSFLDTESIRNGLSVVEGLQVFNEVLKAGMKDANNITGLIMKGVSGLELNSKETTRLTALIDRNYGSKSTQALLKSALNAVAVSAKEDPTQSNEIVEGVKRGFGVMSTGTWTPEQLTAAVSGGQSVGIQPGKAGTFIGTAGHRLSLGASKFLGPKERKELDFAARSFGYANSQAMASAYSKDSFNVFMDSMRKLKSMSPEKAGQVSHALYGTQWASEATQYSQGSEGVDKTYKEVVDPKNANFLEEAAAQRAASLQGKLNSNKSIIGRFWDAFGSGFEDVLNSINDYFMELNEKSDYGKVKSYVSDFMDGLKDSFGISTWKELLNSTFGGNISNLGANIKAFAKGLGDGVQSIGRMIRSVAGAFGGGSMSAETLGSLAGRFFALSVSLIALAPVISILGGLASIIGGIAIAGRGLAGLAGLGAGMAAGAGAGLMRGLGLVLSRLFALTVVAEIGANRAAISAWMLDAGKSLITAAIEALKSAFSRESIQAAMKGLVSEFTPAPVQRWLNSDGKLDEKKALPGKVLDGIGKPPVPVAPAERGIIGKAWDWLSSALVGSANASELVTPPRPNAPTTELQGAIEDNTAALRASLEPKVGLSGLIHRTALSTTGPAETVKAAMTGAAGSIQAALTGSIGGGGVSGGPLSSSVPGSSLGGSSGLSRRGIIGGGYGGGGGGITAPMLKGDAQANAKTSYDFFRSKGLSHEAASGILASMKQESGFNPGARGDGGKAHGLFQHHPDRRAAILRATGIDMSNASVADQLKGAWWEMNHGDAGAQRARKILQTPGISARDAGGAFVQHFERPAKDERASRGAMAEGFAREFGPNSGGIGGAGQYAGLRAKGSQAYAGGASHVGITDLARQVQENLPGGVKHFGAFNDRYHQGTGSKHAQGLAFDTTLLDPGKSREAAQAIRDRIRAAGLDASSYKVIDEYLNPSSRSTGGHIHTQFNNQEAAKRYSDYASSLKKNGESIASSGWKKPESAGLNAFGGRADALTANTPVRQSNLVSPGKIGGADKAKGGSGGGGNATIHINGQGLDAHSIANAVQRRWNENNNRGTHDSDPYTI